MCRDGSRFGAKYDVVVTLGVWDDATIAAINIQSPEEIIAALGDPTKIDRATIGAEAMRVYRYDLLNRRFVWNESADRLLAVNVGDSVSER